MYDGPTLRSFRKDQRVPLGRVARVAGMTRRHLSKVERGQPNQPVTPAILAVYEKGLGVRLTSPDHHQASAGQPAANADRVAAACWQRCADLIFPPTPDRQPAPMLPPAPDSPGWICGHCHRLWPCPDARWQLSAEHGEQPGSLAAFMSVRLFDAAADLGQAEPSTELVDRFLTWVGTGE